MNNLEWIDTNNTIIDFIQKYLILSVIGHLVITCHRLKSLNEISDYEGYLNYISEFQHVLLFVLQLCIFLDNKRIIIINDSHQIEPQTLPLPGSL